MLSVVQRMGFVMSFPTILVIPSANHSLTPISARRKTLYQLALSYAFLLLAISGSAVMSLVLARLAAALNSASTSLFLMWTVDL